MKVRPAVRIDSGSVYNAESEGRVRPGITRPVRISIRREIEISF